MIINSIKQAVFNTQNIFCKNFIQISSKPPLKQAAIQYPNSQVYKGFKVKK